MSLPPFEQIVARHGGTVLRVCRAVLGPDDAGDAWSETFLAALRAYPSLSPDAAVEGWLVTIAHRKALDVIRARRRRPVNLADPPERADPAAGPSDVRIDLWRALATLTDRQRFAVAYHYVAGLPYRQVAEILGGTPDAARRAAADGIAALRRRLSSEDRTEGVNR